MLKNLLVPFCTSTFLSFIITPLLIIISKKYKIFDYPDKRKLHTQPKSRLGGVALFFSFTFTFLIFIQLYQINVKTTFNLNLYLIALFLSFGIGLLDDFIKIKAIYKLLVQIIIATITSLSGLLIRRFTFFQVFTIDFGFFSYILTIIWIVVFMNAINLVDGMDGLSSGVICIASIYVFVISLITNNAFVSYISIVLIGSIIGFYVFNFPPAKIFMGDGGTYLLGFVFSTFGLMGVTKSSVATLLIIPIVLLIIPILDILVVVNKRIGEKKCIFSPDNNHFHHRLLSRGFTVKNIIFIFYSFTIILGLFSVLIVLLPHEYAFIIFTLIFLIVFFSFRLLFILEKQDIQVKMNNNNTKKKVEKLMAKKVRISRGPTFITRPFWTKYL